MDRIITIKKRMIACFLLFSLLAILNIESLLLSLIVISLVVVINS